MWHWIQNTCFLKCKIVVEVIEGAQNELDVAKIKFCDCVGLGV